MNIYELEIQVPWGHLAAKVWGDLKNPIILVFHGLMDNAGSFDRLMPLLPRSFRYACIEFPGHGKSSHVPPFLPLFTINNILVYVLAAQHFKQEKYIIIGHSYGGQLGLLFTQLYPELVEKLVMLDSVHLFPVSEFFFGSYLREKFDSILNLHKKMKTKPKPSYTYTEILQKVKDGRRNGYLAPEAAEALVPRGIQPTADGKFEFTMDQRLKDFINPLHDFSYIVRTMERFPVNCPVLVLLGRESELQQTFFKSIINLMKKRKNFIVEEVDGHHDVHNNEPHVVEPNITRFLVGKTSKL